MASLLYKLVLKLEALKLGGYVVDHLLVGVIRSELDYHS